MTGPDDFTAWKAARRAALVAEDGWLNLTDRIALGAGWQSIGGAAGNDLVVSNAPPHLGRLRLTDSGAELETPEGRRDFAATSGNPMLKVGDLLLEIHRVDADVALRVRDLRLRREVRLSYFPYDAAWNLMAVWEEREAVGQTIGQTGAGDTVVSLTHRAQFATEGLRFTLLATHWKGGLPMFVIRDATAGLETYAASRFLIGLPMGDRIRLDFNRLHNPPCAFTEFAICPLPPRENRFAIRIAAGEMVSGI